MSHFVGGSAPAMVRQITEGYTLVNAVSLRRYQDGELKKLQVEIERRLRDLRGVQVDLADIPAIQAKNRRLSRLEGALRVVRGVLNARGRTGA